MTTTSAAAAALAASRTSVPNAPAHAAALIHAARLLLPALERGQPIEAAVLRAAMERAVGASDSEGAWDWKSAYDASEAAAVLFLRKFGGAMAARAGSAAALLTMLTKMARLLPSHTRRSVESEELQQFSTPVPLALVASTAAAMIPADDVLEPSAGTGLLAIFAELAGASLLLNELAEARSDLLGHLFPDVRVTRFDAAHINDHLDSGIRRFIGAQVILFDRGRSARAATLAMGGESIELGLEGTLSLQPLSRIDEPGEIAFALQWVTALLTSEGVRVTPDVKDAVWTALQSLASAPRQERTLTGLAVLMQSNALVAALSPYTLEGAYGRLLDGASEELAKADILHIEMEELMPHKALVPPALTYLFHRLEARFDGRPTLLVLDEAWTFLDDALFAARIREWLKTLRKKNVAVVFATQSLADIERSSIAPALIESCPTRIFLPNDRALEPQAKGVYERFGLNARQIEILSTATPKRDYYTQTARGNRLFELGLGPVALALCGSSTPDDHKIVDRCLAQGDKSRFLTRFLDTKGLGWAGELVEHWLARNALAPTVSQPSAPIDQVQDARTGAPSPDAGRPAPKAAARALDARTPGAAPLPGLPGGLPLPERLSPFRVVAGKTKRGGR